MINNVMKALHTTNGQYIISFILGIGLASLFRKVCKDRGCIVFKAPDFDDVTKNIYAYGDKCYTFKKSAVSCGGAEREINI